MFFFEERGLRRAQGFEREGPGEQWLDLAALGAKVARPDRQIVAFRGDGGLMNSTEQLTPALRHGIDFIAIVFNNHAYGASRRDQMHRFGARFIGTDLHNPYFMKLAERCGVTGLR